MVDLLELFTLAAKGMGQETGVNPFASAFDVTPDQSKKAVEAMLPMIAAILQRQMSDPQAAANWVSFLASMPQAKIQPSDAATKAAAQLFGSTEIADAVADQISASSGVTQAVSKAMLPWVAAMMVGGLAAAKAKPGEELDDMTGAMKPMLANIPNPMGPKSFADDTFGEFVRGYNRGRPAPQPEPELTDAEKMLQQIVDVGRQAQAAQAEAFETLLDGWFGRKA